MSFRRAAADNSALSSRVAAAMAASALFLAAPHDGARAADSGPLTSAPLLYDSADKLIGPYYAGTAYINFKARTFEVIMYSNGLLEGSFSTYYASIDCTGTAFLPKTIIPNMHRFRTKIYYPASDARLVRWLSKKVFFAGSEPRCESASSGAAEEMSKVMKAEQSELGIAFPVRVEAPN